MKINWSKLKVQLTYGGVRNMRVPKTWYLDDRWNRNLQDYDLWLVWGGRGSMTLSSGRVIELRAGMCFWMRPGCTYHATTDPHDRLCVTSKHFNLLNKQGKPAKNVPLPSELCEWFEIDYINSVMLRVLDLEQLGDLSHEIASTLLQGLLMDYERMTWQRASQIRSKTELRHHCIVQNLMLKLREDSNLSIHYYAKKQGYCSDHLCRVFRKVVGMSPKAFAVRVRIDHARQLLQESSLSISEIANVLGYEDVYFFSKQFKEKISFSPTEYRLSNNR